MQHYKDFVETLAKEGQDKLFFNSGPTHAAIVMSRIFKYSSDHVRIFCGGFDGTVSNDESYLNNLQAFLEKGGKVSILATEDKTENESCKIFALLKKYSKQVDMRLTHSKVVDSTTKNPIHFTIGDSRMLRVETGVEDYTAQVNFGNEEKAKMFISIFDNMLKKTPGSRLLSN